MVTAPQDAGKHIVPVSDTDGRLAEVWIPEELLDAVRPPAPDLVLLFENKLQPDIPGP